MKSFRLSLLASGLSPFASRLWPLAFFLVCAHAQPTPPTNVALSVNGSTGVIFAPVSAATFRSANGIASASAVVSSITGTANEISASASTGAVTLSLPSALTFTGKTITGGTYSSGAFNGTLGATTPSTVSATTLTASSTVTLSALNTANGLLQTNGSGVLSTTLTPSGLTSLGVNSVTSAALSNLTLGTGTFGTALTVASATGNATFAGQITGSTSNGFGSALAATGYKIYSNSSDGLVLAGFGSATDVIITNRSGSAAISVAANTVNTTLGGGLSFTSSATNVADFTGLTKSGTSTTSAAILGKSMGLSENAFIGGTLYISDNNPGLAFTNATNMGLTRQTATRFDAMVGGNSVVQFNGVASANRALSVTNSNGASVLLAAVGGNSTGLALQTTNGSGTVATFLSGDLNQNTTLAGNLTVNGGTINNTLTTNSGISYNLTNASTGTGANAGFNFTAGTAGTTLIQLGSGWTTSGRYIQSAFLIDVQGGSAGQFNVAQNGSIRLTVDGSATTVGGSLIVSNSQTPASSGATGTTGTIAWDSSYVYVCTATNTWKRAAIATW